MILLSLSTGFKNGANTNEPTTKRRSANKSADISCCAILINVMFTPKPAMSAPNNANPFVRLLTPAFTALHRSHNISLALMRSNSHLTSPSSHSTSTKSSKNVLSMAALRSAARSAAASISSSNVSSSSKLPTLFDTTSPGGANCPPDAWTRPPRLARDPFPSW